MNPYVNDFNTTVQTYYKDLKKYHPISREREIELFKSIRNNNIEAKNEIIKSNLKFVFNVAKKYKGKGVPLEDLIMEGNLALHRAIDKFDEEKGIKFISYAVWWIRQAMQECINKRNKIYSNETFEEDNLSKKSYVIDYDFNNEDNEYIEDKYDITSEEDDLINELSSSKKEVIKKLLKKLPSRSKTVIINYYGLNNEEEKNLEEIGEILGITKERVRQIKEKCLKILRSEILLIDNYDDLFV